MKTRLIALFILALSAGFAMLCNGAPAATPLPAGEEETASDAPLNEIRFANFGDKDWLDNDYIRSLRKHLDEVAEGKVEDSELKPYLNIIKGKFVILNIEPALMGGAFIQIVFVDHPTHMFTAWVYSDVNPDTKTVDSYETRLVKHGDEPLELTKEQILEIVKAHPELKLW